MSTPEYSRTSRFTSPYLNLSAVFEVEKNSIEYLLTADTTGANQAITSRTRPNCSQRKRHFISLIVMGSDLLMVLRDLSGGTT